MLCFDEKDRKTREEIIIFIKFNFLEVHLLNQGGEFLSSGFKYGSNSLFCKKKWTPKRKSKNFLQSKNCPGFYILIGKSLNSNYTKGSLIWLSQG